MPAKAVDRRNRHCLLTIERCATRGEHGPLWRSYRISNGFRSLAEGTPAAVAGLSRGTDNKKPIVELRLTGGAFGACAKRVTSGASAGSPPAKTIRQLWGKAKGRFRTTGQFAAATVRGTVWLTRDRCDGTLVQVKQGVVKVSDRVKRKTVSVRSGQSYLAKR